MKTKRGVASTIILIIIALIALGYYNISLRSLVESPIINDNLMYVWNLVVLAASQIWTWLTTVLPEKIELLF